MKKTLTNIFLIFLSFIISLILVETGYRIYLQVVNPVTVYQPGGKVLSPNGRGEYRGGYVSLDKFAFRNTHDLLEREKKILIVGDSFSFGMGVDDNDVFTHYLNEDYEKIDTGFINLSHPGWDTIHLVRNFRKYEIFFRPYAAII